MNQTTVWLVEDETSISEALAYVMQLEGFTVRAFERGLPVLTAARQALPDVIVLDVGLPDISGF